MTERGRPVARLVNRLERIPLRTRLVAILVVLLLLALTLTTAATALLLKRDLMSRVDAELRAAQPVVDRVITDLSRTGRATVPTGYGIYLLQAQGPRIAISDPTGIAARPDVPDLTTTDPRVRSGQAFTIGSLESDMPWRVVARPASRVDAVVVIGIPLQSVNQTVGRMTGLAMLFGLAAMTAAAVLGWYAVRRTFRPLTQIEDTAEAIAGGDLTRRIPTHAADDEVASLARSLNSMLAQIETSFAARRASEERMRQFVADASHELRTPLATVRGYAELYRQGAIERPADVTSAMARIEGEATRMSGLVEDLLMLARLDETNAVAFGDVDLTVIAVDAVQDAIARDPERRITVRAKDGRLAPAIVRGDEASLRQVVTNLVGNATAHTPAGTPIEVVLGRDGADVVIEIRDHGPGVDPAQARKIFERFYRADPSRTRSTGGGTGLGLAIVAAIVTRHHGRVGLTPTPGGGATFLVALPAAALPANSQRAPSRS